MLAIFSFRIPGFSESRSRIDPKIPYRSRNLEMAFLAEKAEMAFFAHFSLKNITEFMITESRVQNLSMSKPYPVQKPQLLPYFWSRIMTINYQLQNPKYYHISDLWIPDYGD